MCSGNELLPDDLMNILRKNVYTSVSEPGVAAGLM